MPSGNSSTHKATTSATKMPPSDAKQMLKRGSLES